MRQISLGTSACLLLLLNACGAAAAEPAAPERCQGNPVCRLKQVEKEIKKTVYSEKCIPYCQSDCCCLDGIHHLCCPGYKCEPPRYRKVLMKKQVVTGKKCELQCVLEYEPVCPSPGEGGPIEPDVPPAPATTAPPAPPAMPPLPRRHASAAQTGIPPTASESSRLPNAPDDGTGRGVLMELEQ